MAKKIAGETQLNRIAYREDTGMEYSPYTTIERGDNMSRGGESTPSDIVSYDKAARESYAGRKSIARQKKINADKKKRKNKRAAMEKMSKNVNQTSMGLAGSLNRK